MKKILPLLLIFLGINLFAVEPGRYLCTVSMDGIEERETFIIDEKTMTEVNAIDNGITPYRVEKNLFIITVNGEDMAMILSMREEGFQLFLTKELAQDMLGMSEEEFRKALKDDISVRTLLKKPFMTFTRE